MQPDRRVPVAVDYSDDADHRREDFEIDAVWIAPEQHSPKLATYDSMTFRTCLDSSESAVEGFEKSLSGCGRLALVPLEG